MRLHSRLALGALAAACASASQPARVPATASPGNGAATVRPAANPALADSVMAADAARSDSVARLGYLDGMMATLAPDVVYLRGGQPMAFGQLSVRAMLASALPAGAMSFRWQPVRVGVSNDGTVAYTMGIAASSSSAGTQHATIRLDRYIAFWRRQEDGAWRVQAYAEIGPPPAKGPVLVNAGGPRPLHDFPSRDSLAHVLESTDSVFSADALHQGLAHAFGTFAAPDAMTFAGSRFVVGPAAIRAEHMAPGEGSLSWRAVAGDAANSADMGFTVGRYTFTVRGGVVGTGKYLTIWVEQPLGAWRYVADGGNADPSR